MQPIHFFRKGRQTPMSGEPIVFSDAELRQVAESYSASRHEAPIVVGHPKTDAPAYGWVSSVTMKDDGLYASVRNVNPEFAELVKAGSFSKVSASLYPPAARGNPTPGMFHLRHIGFLGAQPPAVKGLRPIEFASGEGESIEFEEGLADLREYRLLEGERRLSRREIETRVRTCNAQGRLPKGLLAGALAFAETFDRSDTFEFGEGEDAEMADKREWFLNFLERLPVPAVLGEIAAAGSAHEDEAADFASPEGYTVDNDGEAVRQAALDFAKKNNVSFAEAVMAVSRAQKGMA